MNRIVTFGEIMLRLAPNGGVAKLKALAGPYRKLYWMPTGGVNTDNLGDYLGFHQVLVCGGTWMVKKDLIENEKWDEIASICKDAVKTMLGFAIHLVRKQTVS